MRYVIGIDLGGTAVNYTVVDEQQNILVEGLCEHPARAVEGPKICINQIAEAQCRHWPVRVYPWRMSPQWDLTLPVQPAPRVC